MFVYFKKRIYVVVESQLLLMSQKFMVQGENGSFWPQKKDSWQIFFCFFGFNHQGKADTDPPDCVSA